MFCPNLQLYINDKNFLCCSPSTVVSCILLKSFRIRTLELNLIVAVTPGLTTATSSEIVLLPPAGADTRWAPEWRTEGCGRCVFFVAWPRREGMLALLLLAPGSLSEPCDAHVGHAFLRSPQRDMPHHLEHLLGVGAVLLGLLAIVACVVCGRLPLLAARLPVVC